MTVAKLSRELLEVFEQFGNEQEVGPAYASECSL